MWEAANQEGPATTPDPAQAEGSKTAPSRGRVGVVSFFEGRVGKRGRGKFNSRTTTRRVLNSIWDVATGGRLVKS